MKHIRATAALVLLLCILLLSGCALLRKDDQPGDTSGTESRYDDAGIKTSISTALLRLDAAKANDVSVHCYNGHVFLIGEADKEFRAEALDIARKVEGVVHVTAHWFPPGTSATLLDAAIEADIDARKLFADAINARRVGIDVWGGHVVLSGLVSTQAEIDNTVATIKSIKLVKSVTSYIELPPAPPEHSPAAARAGQGEKETPSTQHRPRFATSPDS